MSNRYLSQLNDFVGFFRLRTILIVPFVIQISLVAGLISYLSLQNSHDSAQKFIHQLRQELSQKIYDHLVMYLQTPLQINQVLINSLELGIGDVHQPRSLEPLFVKTMQDFPIADYLQLGNEAQGSFFGYERLGNKFQVEIVDAETAYSLNAYETDTQGFQVKSKLIRSTPNYKLHTRPWYAVAAQSKRTAWSEIYMYFGSPRLVVTLSSPVFQDNQFVGVTGTDLALSEINNFLQQQRIAKTGFAFIAEASSQLMVATSTGELPFTQPSQAQDRGGKALQRLSILESQHVLTAQTAHYVQRYFTDLQQIQASHPLDFDYEGEHYYLQVMPYRDPMGLNWLIYVVIPEVDFMAPIRENTRLALVLMLIALVIATIIGLMTTYWIVSPINRLNQAAQSLARGNWEYPLPSNYRNEIGELASSFESMAKQLKDMFIHLEFKVHERTQELAQANEEIRILNGNLQQENKRMGMELEIARRLQQMVLPRAEELEKIKCLDIAVFMEPASEVGGDYYDILQDKGRIKIGIGDVTGHGLESGVLMLMVQTAVRTLLLSGIEPKEFLNVLNHTLYGNLQRMQSDKNLTLSLLDYQDGNLRLCGQHEDVLYVSKTGKIERIDTFSLGFMVGVEPDIAQFVAQHEVNLAQGEGIVLYTDGITEALNDERQFYGLDRLCEVISQHWLLSALEIQQAVIDDLRRHIGTRKLQDDITLLVIKQQVTAVPTATP